MTTTFILGHILFGGYFFFAGTYHFLHVKSLTIDAKRNRIPFPSIAVVATGALLVAGGMGVLLNKYVRLAVGMLLFFMIPMNLLMHAFWNEKDTRTKKSARMEFLKNWALTGALLMMM